MASDKNTKIDMNKTFKQGLGGGILGAFVGAPGLGMGLGMAHANKERLRQWGKDFSTGVDNTMKNPFGNQFKSKCPKCGFEQCKCGAKSWKNPQNLV